VTSQRSPSLSALHELVVLVPDTELVVAVLPVSMSVELVTLVELLEETELVTFVELRVSIELALPAAARFPSEANARSASAIAIPRYLISVAPRPGHSSVDRRGTTGFSLPRRAITP
jgi:hypothetical protein